MHVRQFGLQDALSLQDLSHLRRPERGLRRITRSVVISFLMIAAIPMTPRSCAVISDAISALAAALAVVFAVVGLLLAIPACNSSSHGPSAPAPASAYEEYNGPPLFEDVTSTSGVKLTYRNGEEANNFAILESLGGGVALIDYDGDGLLDLFVPGGGYYDGKKVTGPPPANCTATSATSSSRTCTPKVGLDKVVVPVQPRAAAADYDRDGWPDLLVTGWDRLVLCSTTSRTGPGGRRFVDVTTKAKLDDNLWATQRRLGRSRRRRLSRALRLPLRRLVLRHQPPHRCTYDGKTRDVCPPRQVQAPAAQALSQQPRRHLHRRARSRSNFARTARASACSPSTLTATAAPTSTSPTTPTTISCYMNRGSAGAIKLEEDAGFTASPATTAATANGSMGVDAADYDRQAGHASVRDQLRERASRPLHATTPPARRRSSVTTPVASGIAAIGQKYVGWGTGFSDFDLDGWDDMFIANGHAIRFPTKIDRRQKPVLFAQ